MQRIFRLTLAALLILSSSFLYSQNIKYARTLIDTLSSPAMEGRGYVNNGDLKAAGFLQKEMENNGLKAFKGGFLQEHSFPMNALPGTVKVSLSGHSLKPGSDFLVWAATPTIRGTFPVVTLKEKYLTDPKKRKRKSGFFAEKFILIHRSALTDKSANKILDSLRFTNFLDAKGILMVTDRKLTWSVMAGTSQRYWPVIEINTGTLVTHPRKVSVDIESRFNPSHKSANVLAYVQGAVQPDTFLVFTAHYDHLGRMGSEVFFPGANDNASGTAMVCDLARHYASTGNQPYYSMAFFLLSGEEAGLFGAKYCAEHLPMDAGTIKFLINLDMVGTGSEGITMVNGTLFTKAFEKMEALNAGNEYLLTVKQRGESCNSDHCPFYQKGIPAVFIYSMGKEFGEYHNPDDCSEKLPLSEYEDIFRLMRDFMNSFTPN